MKPIEIRTPADAVRMARLCQMAADQANGIPPFLTKALTGARDCYYQLADDLAEGRVKIKKAAPAATGTARK